MSTLVFFSAGWDFFSFLSSAALFSSSDFF